MTQTSFPENPLTMEKRQWSACPKCGTERGELQSCKNGCDTWTVNNVGSWHGVGFSAFQTRGGPRGHLAEKEK